MANKTETTFGNFEMDERYKKLERSLKLAMLKGKSSENIHNRMEQSVTTWPSISSINAGTIDSSCPTPSLQLSNIGSEVLASSNNLKSVFSKMKAYNINKEETIATSSVKRYNTKRDNHIDQYIMPPPTVNKVYRALKNTLQNRVHALPEYEKSVSTPLNSSIQSFPISNFSSKNSNIDTASCVTANTNSGKEYLHSHITPVTSRNDLSKLQRVFSMWKVMLNDQHQLIIKGTLECGTVVRSKPVVKRYSTTCIESIFKHKYYLQGNITDERNELPDYIRGKFYNGFPDDWQNVHQMWSTFVSQGCLVTFRWPTSITDSDDDLKSEMTDLTYTYEIANKNNTLMTSYETIENAKQVIQPESLSNRSLKKVEKYENCTRSTQSFEEEPTFVKSSVPNIENGTCLSMQTSDASNEENRQNAGTNVDQQCSPRKTNKLKDFLQEDKLNIIINNLADRNCSPKYIDKIIEMFDCLDYVMSYKSATECNSVSESCNTSRSEVIPLQQISVCNKDNHMNENKLEKRTRPESHTYSADLGYGSIRNDTEPSQVEMNARDGTKPEHDRCEDSDNSESETYAGVPKISIERVFQSKEALRRLPKRKVRKKPTQPDQQMQVNEQHNAIAEREFIVRSASLMANDQRKNLLPNESCVSITEEEVEEVPVSPRMHHRAANVFRKPQDATFCSYQLQRKDSNVHEGNVADPAAQRMQQDQHKQLLNFFHLQNMKPNVSKKEPNSRGTQEKIQPQSADVVYTTIYSDVEEDVATDAQRMRESAEAECQVDLRRDVMIVNNENNSDFSEKSRASREARKEFVEPSKNETVVIKSKPTIVSSIPVHLNLKITKADMHLPAHDSDVSITDNEDKRRTDNVCPKERTREKPAPKTSVAAKPAPVANESLPKTTTDSKKENHATSNSVNNMRNESNGTNSTGSTKSTTNAAGQSRKQIHKVDPKVLTAWMPKVVHDPTSKSELGLTFQGKLLK